MKKRVKMLILTILTLVTGLGTALLLKANDGSVEAEPCLNPKCCKFPENKAKEKIRDCIGCDDVLNKTGELDGRCIAS